MDGKIIQSLSEMGIVFVILVCVVKYLKSELDKNQKKYDEAKEDLQDFMKEIMQESKVREEGYRETINKLTVSLEVVGQIDKTINEVKQDLKELQRR